MFVLQWISVSSAPICYGNVQNSVLCLLILDLCVGACLDKMQSSAKIFMSMRSHHGVTMLRNILSIT